MRTIQILVLAESARMAKAYLIAAGVTNALSIVRVSRGREACELIDISAEARRIAKGLGWHPTTSPCQCWYCQANRALIAAADEIERLRKETAELRSMVVSFCVSDLIYDLNSMSDAFLDCGCHMHAGEVADELEKRVTQLKGAIVFKPDIAADPDLADRSSAIPLPPRVPAA